MTDLRYLPPSDNKNIKVQFHLLFFGRGVLYTAVLYASSSHIHFPPSDIKHFEAKHSEVGEVQKSPHFKQYEVQTLGYQGYRKTSELVMEDTGNGA